MIPRLYRVVLKLATKSKRKIFSFCTDSIIYGRCQSCVVRKTIYRTPANHQSGTVRVTHRHPKAFVGPSLLTALAAGDIEDY